MNVQYHPDIFQKLKKVDVRIRKGFREKIKIFKRNPLDPQLHNHELKKEYQGLRSINITADYRAIYVEMGKGEHAVAYFTYFGTHEELYGV